MNKNPRLTVSIVFVSLIIIVVLVGPCVIPHDPYMTNLSESFRPPSTDYIFGTDNLGRCVLCRIIAGGRLSVFTALAVVGISLVTGTLLGLCAGYFGGPVDEIISDIITIFQAFPSFVLAIAIAGLLGQSLINGILALAAVYWTTYAKMSRSLVQQIRAEPYVKAAWLAGADSFSILRKHILPGISGALIVTMALDIGNVVLSLAGLSFLGLGPVRPTAQWGAVMSEARDFLQQAPWIIAFNGIALFSIVVGFNLFGEALDETINENIIFMKKGERVMRRKLTILTALILAAVCFAGCGGNAESDSSLATGETAQEKVLRVGATSGFFGAESLDVANGWDGWIMSIYGISENLFRLDENYVPQPYLAESYQQIDDNTWEFVIKDGIRFSNGNEVTADAVKACFERTYEMNERAEATLSIDSMEADGKKLTIKTKTPNPTMLNDLCDPLLGIYDAGQEADPELGLACTGPYVAAAFTAMEHVSMTKNADYWQGEPKLDGVELSIIDDQNTLTMALQNGDIDMIARLDASAAGLFADDSEYTIDSAITSRSAFLLYNLTQDGINDHAVRQAIGYCIDRENFANVIYGGYAEPCYGVFSSALPFGGTQGLTLTVDRFDPDKAAQILKDAGYEDTNTDGTLDKDGNELSFRLITYSYNTETLQLADTLQSELAGIGIRVDTRTYDSLVDTEKEGDFDIAIDSYAMAPIGTPQYFTNLVFASDASDNFGRYSSKTVDELAEKMGAEFDVDKQYEYARRISQEILNDRPFDFVGGTNLIFAYKNYVGGVTVNPSEYYLITYDMYVEK